MSTRLTILRTLIKHGQSTYDDLELNTGIARDKLRIAINDAKKAGHVDLKKDEPTGLPAYSITPDGRAWVKKNGTSAADFAQEAREAGQELAKAEQKPEKAPIPTAVTLPPRAKSTPDDSVAKEVSGYQMSIDHLTREKTKMRHELEEARNESIKLQGILFRIGELIGCKNGDIIEERIAALMNERAQDQLRQVEEPVAATLEQFDPVGYLVVTPKKLRRFKKEANAQAQAMAHARTKGTAEVFTLYPHAKATPGAEWKRHA